MASKPWEQRIQALPTSEGLRCLTKCELPEGTIIHDIHLAQLARRNARDGGRLIVEIVPDGLGWDDPLPQNPVGSADND